MNDIADQIRQRLGAIAKSRAGLDGEERRLRAALDVIEGVATAAPLPAGEIEERVREQQGQPDTVTVESVGPFASLRMRRAAEKYIDGFVPATETFTIKACTNLVCFCGRDAAC